MTRAIRWAFWTLTLAALVAVPASAADQPVASAWMSAPAKIDGQMQEWQNVPMLTDKDSKAQYAFANDGQDLYVVLVFKSPEAASTIEATGLKVYYGPVDKKSKDRGVHFLKRSVTADDLIANLEKQGETLSEARKAEIRQKKDYFLFEADVINPKKVPAPTDPAVKTEPPLFRSARAQGQGLVYECRIPLSRANQPGGLGLGPGDTVKIGFDWGGLTPEMKRNMMAPSGLSGARTSSDDNLANPRNDEAREGGAMLRHDPKSKEHAFWIDVKLAYPKRP